MDLIEKYGGWLLAAALAAISWFSKRDVGRYDKGLERISELELSTVTHEQLDRILSKIASERAAMHIENTQWLQRIEDKIDENEGRAVQSRLDTQEAVHAVAISVANLRSQ